MENSTQLLSWIVFIPFFASLLNGLLYIYNIKINKIDQSIFSFIGVLAPSFSFILTFVLFMQFQSNDEYFVQNLFTWIALGDFNVNVAFLGDQLSIFMALFITFVGSMIHLYAVGYMDTDEGFGKFFAYFNLFVGFMLLLVLANNPVILFIGWEGVGLCSYLLISFYYEDSQNIEAGNKAIYLNRVGDLGFLLGLVVLFFGANLNSFDFQYIAQNVTAIDSQTLWLSGILFFIGAVGKSAQFPLYVWLPDAMRGPTPISALIHAATMVTAGIYLIARFHFLYDNIIDVGLFIAYIGAFTAFFSAIIATKQNDLKKIYAYSTISQLGYMFMAAGVGLYSAGLFHVFTHAFFKAVLFMGAGAVIIYTHHKQDIFEIAKNRVSMPYIRYSMLIASLAICAFPPFSGFFSKDLILSSLFAKELYPLWVIAVVTAFITSYYIFRAYIIIFHSHVKHQIKKANVHIAIGFSVVTLAIGAVIAGFLNVPHILGGESQVSRWFANIDKTNIHLNVSTELFLIVLSILVSFFGAFLAYKKYINIDIYNYEQNNGLIENKFYIDELYHKVFVKTLQKISIFFSFKIDRDYIDKPLMSGANKFVILGKKVAKLQSGDLSFYAIFMLISINAIILYLYFVMLG